MRRVFATAIIAGAMAVLGGTAPAGADTVDDEYLVLFSEPDGQGESVRVPIEPGECETLVAPFPTASADNSASPFEAVLHRGPGCLDEDGAVVWANHMWDHIPESVETWSVSFREPQG
jgi:hypothetical protein